MRKIFTLLFYLISISLYCQDRKTTEIITTLNDSINKNEIIQMLINTNNFIDNEKYNVITTEYRSTSERPGWSYTYNYRIVLQDTKFIIKPNWKLNVQTSIGGSLTNNSPVEWNYSKGKNNINGIIFRETIKMLTDNGFKDITYN
ncbi:hypothetical protein HX109_15535 [Galbibacter sp. BG1]|uniref:hypothetical protein n=1 Tax=Galbibacter sp. BG1 TaxID=1170699 RepID=UPI0015BB82C9|nr:hypothetical protein [Galbibacter sp. BG1]QLE02912.1 hypothetical protein HX109_15535 [Galbibacter sp. BG1]